MTKDKIIMQGKYARQKKGQFLKIKKKDMTYQRRQGDSGRSRRVRGSGRGDIFVLDSGT